MGKLTNLLDDAAGKLREKTMKMDAAAEKAQHNVDNAKKAVTDTIHAVNTSVENVRQAGEDARAKTTEKINDAMQSVNQVVNALQTSVDNAEKAATARAEEARRNVLDTVDAIQKAGANAKKEAQARVAQGQKALADAKAQAQQKQAAITQKIQSDVDETKARVQAMKDARSRKDTEEYIAQLVQYAENCQDCAVLLQAESDLAFATAAEAVAEYIEQYGDAE